MVISIFLTIYFFTKLYCHYCSMLVNLIIFTKLELLKHGCQLDDLKQTRRSRSRSGIPMRVKAGSTTMMMMMMMMMMMIHDNVILRS